MKILRRFLARDAVRRAIRTWLITTLGLLVPGLLGWLHALTAWADGQGSTPFPDAHGLAYLAVSASVATASAVTGSSATAPAATSSPVPSTAPGSRWSWA